MIQKINQIFEENYVNAQMNEKAVIVNCGKVFTETVTSVENTLKSEGIQIGETYWSNGINVYVIPVIKIPKIINDFEECTEDIADFDITDDNGEYGLKNHLIYF